MSKFDITATMNDWEYALYNDSLHKEERINKLIRKYGFPVREKNLLEEDYVEYDLLKEDLAKMEARDSVYKTLSKGASLDDEDMAKNAEKLKVKEEKQSMDVQTDEDAEALRRIREESKEEKNMIII